MKYRPRIVDSVIDDYLQIGGAVLLEGCKWCGKTTSAEQHAKSAIKFQNPDFKTEYDRIAQTRPSLFLEGEKPRLLDEWQRYPVVWDAVRTDVDQTGLTGQYLLTGSARPADGSTMHTGTGRINRVVMRPMSLYESGFSDGKVSLADIFANKDIEAANNTSLEQLADYISWGGWPNIPDLPISKRHLVAQSYVDSVIHEEVNSLDNSERNYDKMNVVLKSLSRNLSTPVTITTIEKDSKLQFDTSVSRITIRDYLKTLRKLFVYYDIPATTLAFRSKTAIRTTPKKELVDPSIAMAMLAMDPINLIHDLRTFGFMFECMAIRDLIVYGKKNGEGIYYYRDAEGAEIDAIIYSQDGKWGAVEIKLGAGQIDEAAQNLISFQNKLSPESEQPAFLMVLTGTNYSYQREDDVYVVSLASLKD